MEDQIKQIRWSTKNIPTKIGLFVLIFVFYIWSAMPAFVLMRSAGLDFTFCFVVYEYFYSPVFYLNDHWPWLDQYMSEQMFWYWEFFSG